MTKPDQEDSNQQMVDGDDAPDAEDVAEITFDDIDREHYLDTIGG